MRFARTIALVGVALLAYGLGPIVLVLAALSLLHPATRLWLRPSLRVVVIVAAAALVVAGLAVVVPDGWVPIPPGPGAWATPAYVGRPSSTHAEQGPVGESPTVSSKSYGVPDCRRLLPDGDGRLVTVCGGDHPVLRLVDPDTLRQLASKELPGTGCVGQVATAGRAVVVASDRRLLSVSTPDLAVTSSIDLGPAVHRGDCVTGLSIDSTGRAWFATRSGVVGAAYHQEVRTVDVDDEVDRPLAVAGDGAYVPGSAALVRVALQGDRLRVAWRSAYDGGERGSAPVPLPGGLVAVADNRDPRLQVVMHRADTGAVVCRAEVFEDDDGATDGGLVAAGSGVVVLNSAGYAGPRSATLGRTPSRGIARIGRDCRVAWTTDMSAPSGTPAVSVDDGVVYVWTKRHSWLGVDAWYLSALDLATGRLVWARRVGLDALFDNAGGALLLGPGKAVYAPVLGGVVRVADRSLPQG